MFKHDYIQMTDIPRCVHFPFPVMAFGNIEDSRFAPLHEVCYTDKLEFCFRFRADAPQARDRIAGVDYHTPYPNRIVKLPFAPHCYEVADHRDAFYLIYDASLLPTLRQAGIPLDPPVQELNLTERLLDRVAQLKDQMRNSCEPGMAEQIDLLAFELLEELVFSRTGGGDQRTPSQKQVLSIASWIKLHYHETFSLQDLMERNGLSRRTFFRCWRECFPCSALEFIQNLRMNEAERLLRQGEFTVGEISDRVGFDNTSHFIRLFRRIKGCTPKSYRQIHSGTVKSEKKFLKFK